MSVFDEIGEVIDEWVREYQELRKKQNFEKPLNFLKNAPKINVDAPLEERDSVEIWNNVFLDFKWD